MEKYYSFILKFSIANELGTETGADKVLKYISAEFGSSHLEGNVLNFILVVLV